MDTHIQQHTKMAMIDDSLIIQQLESTYVHGYLYLSGLWEFILLAFNIEKKIAVVSISVSFRLPCNPITYTKWYF